MCVSSFAYAGDPPGLPLTATETRGFDTNGDGFQDLIIALPDIDTNVPTHGEVAIVSSRDPGQQIHLEGEQANDGFGLAAIGIDDVSGDGLADVVVSAPWYQVAGASVGRVYVFQGSDGSLLRTFTGTFTDGLFGYALADVGDVNGDGVPDLAVGAPHSGASSVGKVYVYSGSDGQLIRTHSGTGRVDRFGQSVAAAGDVNADGRSDILVGAPGNDGTGRDAGAAYVFSGSSGSMLFALSGQQASDEFGAAVAGGADLNGDGRPDVLVGAPRHANQALPTDPIPATSGRAYLFHLPPAGSSVTTIQAGSADQIYQPEGGYESMFGCALVIANDMDADGTRDIAISSLFTDSNNEEQAKVYVHTGTPSHDYVFMPKFDNVPAIVPGDDHVAYDCQDLVCPGFCNCVDYAVQKFNIKMRDAARRWWLLPVCAVPCAAICCPPLTAPAFAACVTCLTLVGQQTIIKQLDAKAKLEEDWLDCWHDLHCPGLAPEFPYW